MLCRFVSEDPIRLAGGDINIYALAHNAPTVFVDPSGLQTNGAGGLGGGASVLGGRKDPIRCRDREGGYAVVQDLTNDPMIQEALGMYRKWWGQIPSIPVCRARLRPGVPGLYSNIGGRSVVLLSENFLTSLSLTEQYITLGHEFTHVWQDQNIPGWARAYNTYNQPWEAHAESVGQAFATTYVLFPEARMREYLTKPRGVTEQ
jgi:hypothetical protein